MEVEKLDRTSAEVLAEGIARLVRQYGREKAARLLKAFAKDVRTREEWDEIAAGVE